MCLGREKLFEKLRDELPLPDLRYCLQLSRQSMTQIIEGVLKGEDVNSDLCL